MKSTQPVMPGEALHFFRQLEKNNRREWFEQHKTTFLEKVRAPMEVLVAAVSAELLKFAPAYATEPKAAIYRIYRDTRFSSNKLPYKTNTSALFYRQELGRNEAAAFYFEVSSQYLGIAAGLYMPNPDYLRAVRTFLLDHHERFTKLATSAAVKRAIGELQGQKLTRPPKGFPCDHPAMEWIKHKQWYYWIELPPETATKPGVVREIVSRFKVTAPVVEFLNEPLSGLRRKKTPLILDL
jgi:uncharacterized protein (TIGR02453 family)